MRSSRISFSWSNEPCSPASSFDASQTNGGSSTQTVDQAWLDQSRWLLELFQRKEESTVHRSLGLFAAQGVLVSIIGPQIPNISGTVLRGFGSLSLIILLFAMAYALQAVLARPALEFSPKRYFSGWTESKSTSKTKRTAARFVEEILGDNGTPRTMLEDAAFRIDSKGKWQRSSIVLTTIAITLIVLTQISSAFLQ